MTSVITQKKYIIFLYLFGFIQGAFLGYWLIKLSKYWKIFSEVKFLSVFSENIVLGILIGLLVQWSSIIFLLILCSYNSKLYIPTTWLYMGMSAGVLASLSVVSGNIVSTGFVLPYIVVLLIPYLLVFFTGTDAMAFLAMNALKIIGLYGVSLLLNYSIKFFGWGGQIVEAINNKFSIVILPTLLYYSFLLGWTLPTYNQ